MLDRQLERQIQQAGRVGCELQVLHVDDVLSDSTVTDDSRQLDVAWERLQQLYPRHKFQRRSISDAVSLIPVEELLSMAGSKALEISPSIRSVLDLLTILPSPTSRADLLLSLSRRLVAHTARELNCASIIFGHTSTRLAELVLSETAKGRGALLPQLVGESAELEGISCTFSARDVMRSEVESWMNHVGDPLGEVSAAYRRGAEQTSQPPVSSKNTTVDQLMTQYFKGVEANYPSIVANVVRTSARLRAPEAVPGELRCSLCALPIRDGRTGLTGWGGDQAATKVVKEDKSTEEQVGSRALDSQSNGTVFCYGCARSLDGLKSTNAN
ncbi:MAG: cytoplasmic tRNA 2-thiolation protein 2 [Stictis urceolatum]|nr:cytoplasmic tRNA 2-thiolation protein 2 [Stictis urceolata]